MAAVTTTTTLTTTSTVCFNTKCNAASSSAWKPGWLMRSGRFADLCDSCGSAYEQLRFCEIFHLDDTGWRICNSCKKRVHCGCIVSLYSFILLDSGGIECIDCAKKSSALNLNLSLIQHLVPLFGYREKFNSLMKELNGNSGTKYPWNNDSGQWLSLPIPWLASTSQTVFPHWSHTPEANTQPGNDPVAENSIIEMTSGVDSSKAEDDSNEKVRDGIRTIGNLASSHPMNFEAMTGETCQVEGLQADLIDSDVKELEDISDSKVSKSQDDAVIGNEDICILQNLGLARQNNPAPETDSKDGSYHMMKELQPSCGASLTMSLSVLPSSASKDITEEVNEQSVGPNISVMDTTFGKSADSKENAKPYGLSSIRHRQRQILPKLSQNQPSVHTQTIKGPSPQVPVRVARPPGEGRGRNQLLPRYWPRITDQELQQITSGDSNCTITPLFEKMLSASDAGRIGRLVLPKACAEAYFPPISQPEGLPLKIQDVSGKDWVFQFRFWPNNNSRMYVLEGVTPCIQSMNLQAGDTVTFSRLNPEGKLVMGYRRAPNSLSSQDHPPDVQMNGQSNLSDAGNRCDKTEKISAKAKEVSAFQSLAIVDRKRGRHLSSKGKRLRIELEESMDLKLSWEEAQQLLRPPPNAIPTIFTIEGHEFEEYEEPPVFGKRTIFMTRLNSLGEDQWARCDECGNWRRVPSDVFLPTRWICADNVWDPKRATCGMPQEVNSEEIDKILQKTKDAKKSDVVDVQKVAEPPSGLDALATAATLGENNAASSSSPAPTTKHPRHRPGCTCIVCIQPPSGKGPKHKPTCVCNVCMTVKRRFKTLMMRRKKRQSEREAENARKKRAWVKEEEVSSVTKWQTESCGFPEGGLKQANLAGTFSGPARRANNISPTGQQFSPSAGLSTTFSSIPRSVGDEYLVGKGQIDLNSQPEREDEPGKITGRISMVRLLQSAAYPLDRYLKQQGLTSLICSKQTIPSIGFGRNVGQKKTDDLMGNQSTILNPDRPQEASFFMLGQEKGDTAAFIQPFNDVDRK